MRENSAAGVRPGTRSGAQSQPDAAQVTRLLEPVLRALDLDLETVRISMAGRRRVLRVIVDGDGGVSLDEIAEVSREVSARLDAKNVMGDVPYTLEVSSPGVDRPLTAPRHWRRATGRLILAPLASANPDQDRGSRSAAPAITGRVLRADDVGVTLDVDGDHRTFGYGELGPGRVQIEFSRLESEPDLDGESADEEEPDAY